MKSLFIDPIGGVNVREFAKYYFQIRRGDPYPRCYRLVQFAKKGSAVFQFPNWLFSRAFSKFDKPLYNVLRLLRAKRSDAQIGHRNPAKHITLDVFVYIRTNDEVRYS